MIHHIPRVRAWGTLLVTTFPPAGPIIGKCFVLTREIRQRRFRCQMLWPHWQRREILLWEKGLLKNGLVVCVKAPWEGFRLEPDWVSHPSPFLWPLSIGAMGKNKYILVENTLTATHFLYSSQILPHFSSNSLALAFEYSFLASSCPGLSVGCK